MNKTACLNILSQSEADLPKEALAWALQHYDEVKAELHTALALSPDAVDLKAMEQDGVFYSLQRFAFYLVAEKRDTQALPLICDFFSRYGEQATDATGDLTTEDLPSILASVGYAQPQILFTAIHQDSDMDTWALGACVYALCILMHEQRLDREQLVLWLLELLQDEQWRGAAERTEVLRACQCFGLVECKEVALKLLKNGQLVQKEGITEQDIQNIEREKVEHEQIQLHYRSMDDAIVALEKYGPQEYLPSSLFQVEFLTIAERVVLSRHLEQLHSDNPAAFLHAYFFAIIHSPELIMPSEWLDPVLEVLNVKNSAESQDVIPVLMDIYNRLNTQRLEQGLSCPIEHKDLHGVAAFDAVVSWSDGFLHGVGLRADLWGSADVCSDAESLSEIDASWAIVLALANPDMAEEMFQESGKPDNDEERVKSLAMLLGVFNSAVGVMLDYAQQGSAEGGMLEGGNIGGAPNFSQNMPVSHQKTGRNEPCPCGSGKKFKKCCGNAARTVH